MSEINDKRDDVFTVERPWGAFQNFATNQNVTVKVITVAPGSRLSLQKHAQRAEMWQVLDDALESVSLAERLVHRSTGRVTVRNAFHEHQGRPRSVVTVLEARGGRMLEQGLGIARCQR